MLAKYLNMYLKYIFIFLFAAICMASFSQENTDSVVKIEEVSISASRIFRKETAGQKETSVDSMVLTEKINLSLSDVLAENTTVFIKNYGRGSLATASFRGTSPTHTQVSWNGINVNSPMLGMVDFSLLPVYIIDDISLQHGPASIGRQSGGLGGHISIENKVNWNNTFSGRYYQGIGSYSTYDEFGQVNLGNKKVQSKTRVYHNYSKNDYPFINKHVFEKDPQTGENIYSRQKNKNGGYQKYGGLQEFYFRPVYTTVLSARVWYQDAYRHIPTVLSYEGSDSTSKQNRQDDNTLKAVLDGKYYGKKIKTRFSSGIDWQQLDYVMTVSNSGSGKNKPVNSASNMLSWYNDYCLVYRFADYFSSTVSLDYDHYDISTLDSANQSGYDVSRNEYSVYGAGFVELFQKINLSLGLRKDWIPNIKTPFIYQIGIDYKPFTRKDLVVKLNFARNFHNPSLNDLYWQPGGNPDLLPEKGYTFEAGLHYILDRKIFLETQITPYYSDVNNWILWLPDVKGYWEPLNLKKVKSYGLEINLKMTYLYQKIKLGVQGNYAYTKSINFGEPLIEGDESEGRQLPFIPVHSANALASVSFKGFYLNYQYANYGIRHLLSSNRKGLVDDSEYFGVDPIENPYFRLYAQHLNHLSAGKNINLRKIKTGIEFKIHNLFNEAYRNALNRMMPQRHYTIMLKVEF